MAQNQYLTEENYNRVNKKFKTISLVILIVGFLVGGILIAIGVIKQNEAQRINDERAAAALAESEVAVAKTKERLSEIETEKSSLDADFATKKSSLESDYNAKKAECDSLNMNASDWFATKNQCERDASVIYSQITDLETEQLKQKSALETERFKLENEDYSVYYNLEQPEKYIPFYIFGAFCIGVSAIISLAIFLITKRRALRAYGIQSTMPVNKEAVEQYAPTAAKVAGDIAGSVAEGISRGIKNGKNS